MTTTPPDTALKPTATRARDCWRAILALLLVIAAAGIAGCSLGIKGDGVVVTTNITITNFSELEASGAYQITWSPGPPALSITTDQNLLPLITTQVSGDKLEIDWQQNLRPTQGIRIHISSAALKDVELNGAVSLTATNLSGAGLNLVCNGASSVSLEGSVTNLDVTFSGANRLAAKSLQTQTASVTMNGASSADVTATESLKASISGAGTITYGGNPKSVDQNVSGAGKIQARR